MKGRVVLIVDDMAIVRQGTALAVRGFGFDIDEAEDGLSALDKFKSTVYAAILMDYNMPRMNGVECTEKIRELEKGLGRRTPIIGITASDERGLQERCLEAGMDDYVDKSCSNQTLQDVLLKWVALTENADRV